MVLSKSGLTTNNEWIRVTANFPDISHHINTPALDSNKSYISELFFHKIPSNPNPY